MISDYKPSPDEIALMESYRVKGWDFRFESQGCHVGSWDDCIVTSPRITFEVDVDLDGWHKPLTEERLLMGEAFALAEKHDDAIQYAFQERRDSIKECLKNLYFHHRDIPTTITESLVIDLS